MRRHCKVGVRERVMIHVTCKNKIKKRALYVPKRARKNRDTTVREMFELNHVYRNVVKPYTCDVREMFESNHVYRNVVKPYTCDVCTSAMCAHRCLT